MNENPLVHRRHDAGFEHSLPKARAVIDIYMMVIFICSGLLLILIGFMCYWADKQKPPDIPEC